MFFFRIQHSNIQMIKNWISAFRLRTLPLALSTIGMGIGMVLLFSQAHHDKINYLAIVLLVITTILLQILSNLANDYGDGIKGTDNENRLGPQRAVQSKLISPRQMKNAVILFAILSFVFGITLIMSTLWEVDWGQILIFIGLGVASIMAAIFYTVGKKAYGYSGFGDLFVFVFFGLVGVIGSFYLLFLEWNSLVLFPAFYIGFLSTAVLNMNNMRDIENDRNSNKNTLVVTMGFEKAKFYHAFLIVAALVSWLLFVLLIQNYWLLLALLPFIVLTKNVVVVFKNDNPRALDAELKKIALSCFFSTLIVVLTLLF